MHLSKYKFQEASKYLEEATFMKLVYVDLSRKLISTS